MTPKKVDLKPFFNSGKKIYETKPTLANNFSLGPRGFYGLLRLFFESRVPPEAGKIWRNSPIFGLKRLLLFMHQRLSMRQRTKYKSHIQQQSATMWVKSKYRYLVSQYRPTTSSRFSAQLAHVCVQPGLSHLVASSLLDHFSSATLIVT